jgi:hypothetical protein
MGAAFVTGSGGTPFDVIIVGSLFWHPANAIAIARAVPMKMDRDGLFIIRSLKLTIERIRK